MTEGSNHYTDHLAGDYSLAHESVARPEEVEQHLQLRSPVTAGTAGLLGADHLAACRLQGCALKGEVLLYGGDAGLSV